MITIFMYARAHKEKIEQFKALAADATPLSRADDGCLNYVFHQQADDPGNFVLTEQWRDREALEAHVRHLYEVYGPPAAGQKLPKSIVDLCESIEIKRFDVLA